MRTQSPLIPAIRCTPNRRQCMRSSDRPTLHFVLEFTLGNRDHYGCQCNIRATGSDNGRLGFPQGKHSARTLPRRYKLYGQLSQNYQVHSSNGSKKGGKTLPRPRSDLNFFLRSSDCIRSSRFYCSNLYIKGKMLAEKNDYF